MEGLDQGCNLKQKSRKASVQRSHLSKTLRWRGSRMCHPKICYFGVVIVLSTRHMKNSKCKESLSLNSPYLPKDRFPKRSSAVVNSPPQEGLLSRGKIDSCQDRRLEACTTCKHCHNSLPPSYSSTGPFTFPKNLSPKRSIYIPLSFPHYDGISA